MTGWWAVAPVVEAGGSLIIKPLLEHRALLHGPILNGVPG